MIASNAMILLVLASVFLVLLFLLVWCVVMVMGATQRNRLFQQEGVVVEGEVVERKVRHNKQHPQYYVIYRFTAQTPDGRAFCVNAEENTWWNQYERLVEGTKVFIDYVPRNPELSRLSPVQRVVPQAAH